MSYQETEISGINPREFQFHKAAGPFNLQYNMK